ncbi:hypothetical protein TELCIR_05089 [Teladorsagia circumcincta]|uniref:Uncharacterized protein n=1 Tax=Teladorsagia circumcincta TaxID=45464 RepID=A0A2G9URR4_TELCI|nr:hypothetical protein TELCIR_05089 [Teladorsagia circumcincta]
MLVPGASITPGYAVSMAGNHNVIGQDADDEQMVRWVTHFNSAAITIGPLRWALKEDYPHMCFHLIRGVVSRSNMFERCFEFLLLGYKD